MSNKSKYNKILDEQALELRKKGYSYETIAKKLGYKCKSHLWYRLRRFEIPERVTIDDYSKLLSENKELRKRIIMMEKD